MRLEDYPPGLRLPPGFPPPAIEHQFAAAGAATARTLPFAPLPKGEFAPPVTPPCAPKQSIRNLRVKILRTRPRPSRAFGKMDPASRRALPAQIYIPSRCSSWSTGTGGTSGRRSAPGCGSKVGDDRGPAFGVGPRDPHSPRPRPCNRQMEAVQNGPEQSPRPRSASGTGSAVDRPAGIRTPPRCLRPDIAVRKE